MHQIDLEPFMKSWSILAELYGKDVTEDAAKLVFSLLSDYELGEINAALRLHAKDSKWMATPADVIERIEGVFPSDSELLSLAAECKTPLGLFMRSAIGEFDMSHLNNYQLNERAKSCRGKARDFFKRVKTGDYTDNEITRMVSASIDPLANISHGAPGVRSPYRGRVAQRMSELKETAKLEHDSLEPETSERDTEAGKTKLAEIMKTLNMEKAS